ncbi:hypothetical protein JCM18920_2073 [Cutibacterium acnes JCM 18920]|nr:hypothetical protein JCM18920_2073 [Cutibacterium acnes JCM 18920]
MIFYGLLYRTHIDDDTISIHIGPFRHTIDAHSITKLAITPNCYLITDGSGHRLRVNHHAHDIDRALLHLLVTLHTRTIDLPEGSPNHPDWPTWPNTGETSLPPPSMTTTPTITPPTLTLLFASTP